MIKLLDAHWDDRYRRYVALFTKLPELKDYTFLKERNIYLGFNQGFLICWLENGEGYSGRTFKINLLDGGSAFIKGPWNCSGDMVKRFKLLDTHQAQAFELNNPEYGVNNTAKEILMFNDKVQYDRGYTACSHLVTSFWFDQIRTLSKKNQIKK